MYCDQTCFALFISTFSLLFFARNDSKNFAAQRFECYFTFHSVYVCVSVCLLLLLSFSLSVCVCVCLALFSGRSEFPFVSLYLADSLFDGSLVVGFVSYQIVTFSKFIFYKY